MTGNRKNQLELLLRKLRTDPRLFDENETGYRIARLIENVKDRLEARQACGNSAQERWARTMWM